MLVIMGAGVMSGTKIAGIDLILLLGGVADLSLSSFSSIWPLTAPDTSSSFTMHVYLISFYQFYKALKYHHPYVYCP
jgi:hypothetical protein